MISCRADLFKKMPQEIVAQIDVYEEPISDSSYSVSSYSVRVFCNNSIYEAMKTLVMAVSGEGWSEEKGWSKDPKDGCGVYSNYETGLWFYEYPDNGVDRSQIIGDSVMYALRNLGLTNKITTAQKESCYNDPNEVVLHMARYYLTNSDIKKLNQ